MNWGVVILVFACALSAQAAEGANPSLPSVLLITVDTLRADHLTCYGYQFNTSPNIDRLANEGTRFDKAYTVVPLTGPAHLSLFTSKYPQEHGARRNGVSLAKGAAPVSFPRILRKHGYRNAAFISGWPLTKRLTHLDRWFHYYDEELPRTYQLFNSSRYAEDVTPRALRWLRGRAGKKRPFFLWIHYFDPHEPYVFREAFRQRKANGDPTPAPLPWTNAAFEERVRGYDSEIAYTDHHIGVLLSALDELKLRESTLVVLTADHGESLGEHDYVGHGRHLFENIIRIPLVVRLPGAVPAGRVISSPVSILDIGPTILDLTVEKLPRYKRPPVLHSGHSFVAAFRDGGRLPERTQYYVTFAGKKGFAPSWLSWLWVHDGELPLRFGRLKGDDKTVWSPGDDSLEIYDVSADRYETRPIQLDPGNSEYGKETASLRWWFSATEFREGEDSLTSRDLEVLKSLGYLQ